MSGQAQLYMDYLAEEGFQPVVHPSGQFVSFNQEGRNYYIEINTSARQYFRIAYPNFWSIDSKEELGHVLAAANHVTGTSMAAKVFLNDDGKNTSAAVEMFLPQPEQFKEVFHNAMAALQHGIAKFKEAMGSAVTRDPAAF